MLDLLRVRAAVRLIGQADEIGPEVSLKSHTEFGGWQL